MHRFLLSFSNLLILTLSLCLQAQDRTVHEIQFTDSANGNSPFVGQQVQVGGIVTGVGFTQPTRYFISDRLGGLWSGLIVYDNVSRTISIGDSVHLTGTVQESSTQTRLNNITGFDRSESVAIPPYTEIGTGGVNESTEGVLLEFHNAIVESILDSNVFFVNDGSGSARIGSGWPYQYEPLVGDTLTVLRGIVSTSNNIYTVNPRSDADFSFSSNRAPLISNVSQSSEFPTELETVTITASISDNGTIASASLFYRFATGGDFFIQSLQDDGLHGDSNAGDGIWGGIIPAGQPRTTCQYYLTATDNENASSFSPVGAPSTTYGYRIRSSTLSIFDLQYTGNPTGGASPYDGQFVTVTGIVTGSNFDGSSFFMSDPGGGPWAGILVFNPSLTPNSGDSVRVTGQVLEYFELTEFTGGAQVTVLGQGRVPQPMDIRADIMRDSAEAYEGTLVRIGPSVLTNNSDYFQYRQFDVRDATGEGTILGDFGLEYVPVVGDSFIFITGCVTFNANPGYMIAPRFETDLGIVDRRPPTLVSAFTVSEHEVNIQISERVTAEGISNLDNYSIIDQTDPNFPELHLLSVSLFSSGKTLHIETIESFIDTHSYRVEIDTLRDAVGNALINNSIAFGGYTPGEFVPMDSLYRNFDHYNGTTQTLRGIVNFVQDVTTTSGSRRISAFMQDNSGKGFSLSQTGAASTYPGIQRGNLITIRGLVNVFSNTIQLGNFTSDQVTVLSEGAPLPVPVSVNTGDLRTQAQIIHTSSPGNYGVGTWCKASGTIYRVDENVGGGTNIAIDDGTGNLTVRIWDSMNLDSVQLDGRWYRLRELVGKNCSIAGPASFFGNDFQMLAGYSDDFASTTLSILPSEDIQLKIADNHPFAPELGQSLKIFYNTPTLSQVRLRVFDLRGHLITTLVDKQAGGPNEINWNGRNELREILPLGTYILHLEAIQNGESTVKVKPVVIGTKL